MSTRADMVARKLMMEEDAEKQARAMCKTDDEVCMSYAKALVKVRIHAEKQKKFHSFEKYAYKDIDDALQEAGF